MSADRMAFIPPGVGPGENRLATREFSVGRRDRRHHPGQPAPTTRDRAGRVRSRCDSRSALVELSVPILISFVKVNRSETRLQFDSLSLPDLVLVVVLVLVALVVSLELKSLAIARLVASPTSSSSTLVESSQRMSRRQTSARSEW